MNLIKIVEIVGELNNSFSGRVEDGSNLCVIFSNELEDVKKLCKKYNVKFKIVDEFIDGNGDSCYEIIEVYDN